MTIYLLAIAVFLLLGIAASKISSLLQVPILLVFLAVGMLAGVEGVGKIPFDNFEYANYLGTIALAFILFSGGYDTRWRDARSIMVCGTLLSTLGVLITTVLLGVFVSYFLQVPLVWGLLFGAVISSTDAAAVFALFQSKNCGLKGRLRPLLEFESGSNDPMAAFLTLFLISMIEQPENSYLMVIPFFLAKMLLGILGGLLIGKAIIWLFDHLRLEYEGLYYVLGIATVFLTFSVTELLGGNGFMAVYVCGLLMGNSQFMYKHGLARFNDGLAWLMQVAIFLTLGLLVTPSHLPEIMVASLVIGIVLIFVIRPIAVFSCLFRSSFNFRERLLVSWAGFRGAAPIVLATFPAIAHFQTADELHHAKQFFDMVFFIVLTSIFLQGKTLMPFARLLQLDQIDKTRLRAPIEFEETGNSNDRLYEFAICSHSAIIGKSLAQLRLPGGALILLIRRNDTFIVPNGHTIIHQDDDLLTFFDPIALPQVEHILNAKNEVPNKFWE